MSELSREALGAAIQRARIRAGLTQGQLGELTGLGQPLISRIEAGTRKVDLVELVRIAAELDLKIDDLLADSRLTAEVNDVTPELVGLRLAQADASIATGLAWVQGFLEDLRRLEQLGAAGQGSHLSDV